MSGNLNTGASYRSRDGSLYFGGKHGFTIIDPHQLRRNPFIPPVVITGFRLFDQLLPGRHEAKEIVLAYDENFISVEFAALSFTHSDKNQYAYQLEGIDQEWVHSGNRHVAAYTDLDPGTYTFRVKASNNDGVWNERGARLGITIRPAWWQTGWLRGGLGLLLTGMLYVGYRYRIGQIRREQQIRDQISRDLHDDVGASCRVFPFTAKRPALCTSRAASPTPTRCCSRLPTTPA